MAEEKNTNWFQSVGAVVICDNKVLLGRHTYGAGKGKLIIPGGYIKYEETPQDALKRELLEETGVSIEPKEILGIRFNQHDWYVVFRADYVSGTARSDEDENSEVIWLEVEELLQREDVPDLTKKLVQMAVSGVAQGFVLQNYDGNTVHGPYSFYGVPILE